MGDLDNSLARVAGWEDTVADGVIEVAGLHHSGYRLAGSVTVHRNRRLNIGRERTDATSPNGRLKIRRSTVSAHHAIRCGSGNYLLNSVDQLWSNREDWQES
jgi:hypothetical protein